MNFKMKIEMIKKFAIFYIVIFIKNSKIKIKKIILNRF